MLLQTDYIILRKVPFQESSLVVSGISPEFGRLDFLLKGVRTSGARKFPYAGLFRELTIEFRENSSRSGLFYLKKQEPKSCFDGIAQYPENYILLCAWVQFLLKHTRPMLALTQTYQALRIVLSRLSSDSGGEFPLAAAELVFLQESGWVPEVSPDDRSRTDALDRLLQYALDPAFPKPEFTPEYRNRLIQWIHALHRYADSL